jgi:hypothetical protein
MLVEDWKACSGEGVLSRLEMLSNVDWSQNSLTHRTMMNTVRQDDVHYQMYTKVRRALQ